MLKFDWDFSQDAPEPQGAIKAGGAGSRELEKALARSMLVSQALWELLRERFQIPEEELLAKIEEIDLRDGRRDQAINPTRVACPKCARLFNTRHDRCIYCGTPVERPHVFG